MLGWARAILGWARLVDEPLQLALREERAHKVDAREAPKVDLAQVEVLEEPIVLVVTVGVLAVTQRVGDALEGVDNGAGAA
eukprot:345647-Prymnesium_polylepis.1